MGLVTWPIESSCKRCTFFFLFPACQLSHSDLQIHTGHFQALVSDSRAAPARVVSFVGEVDAGKRTLGNAFSFFGILRVCKAEDVARRNPSRKTGVLRYFS